MQFWKQRPWGRREDREAKSEPVPGLRTEEMEKAIRQWQDIFRGEPYWLSGKRPRTLNLAAATTQYLARLVCAELQLEISGGKRGSLMEQVLREQLLPQLPAAVQQAMATGCTVLRPYVEQGKLQVEWLAADDFYPVRQDGAGRVTDGVFLDRRSWQERDYVRMERHRFTEEGLYTITQQVFEERAGRIGREVPLHSLPFWQELEEKTQIMGLEAPLFALWKMPFANTVDGSQEPVSLYAGALSVLEDIDRLYNDYGFEFSSARRKMILREDSLRLRADGSPVLPQEDGAADVYMPLDFGSDGEPFADYTPSIRQQEYEQGLCRLIHLYEMQTGVSPGTFALDGSAEAVTATQIISQDRRTYYTVCEIQQQGEKALRQLTTAMDALVSLYGLEPPEDWELTVDFGDSVFEDTGVEFARRRQLVELGMKPELLLAWYFNKTQEEAAAMMAPQKGEQHGFDAVDGGTGAGAAPGTAGGTGPLAGREGSAGAGASAGEGTAPSGKRAEP